MFGRLLQCLFVGAALLLTTSAYSQRREPIVAGDSSISGRVIDRTTQQPIPGMRVVLADLNRGGLAGTDSGPDGEFSFAGIAAGQYRVSAGYPDFVRDFQAGVPGPIDLGPGDRVVGVEIGLRRAAEIHGRVVDQQGKPIDRASVTATYVLEEPTVLSQSTYRATADADGNYRLPRLAEGVYRVSAGANRFRGGDKNGVPILNDDYDTAFYPGVQRPHEATLIRVTWGEIAAKINIPLPRFEFFSLTGRLVTNTPLTDDPFADGLQLTLTRVPSGAAQHKDRGAIDDDGVFTFERVMAGRYILWARATTAGGVEAASLPIDLGGSVEEVVLALQPAGKISGRVVTESGEPLPTRYLRIAALLFDGNADIDRRIQDQMEVAPDGSFTIEGLFGERGLRVFGLPDGWQVVETQLGRNPVERFEILPGLTTSDVTVIIAPR